MQYRDRSGMQMKKRKAKLQKRLGTIKEEYKVRISKLKKASALISEALSSKSEASTEEVLV